MEDGQINPSVKLDYSRVCNEYKDGTKECTEPVVYDYELVNDDAKEIFKDIDLLSGTKDLSSVIDFICDKVKDSGIEVKNVDQLNSLILALKAEKLISYVARAQQ